MWVRSPLTSPRKSASAVGRLPRRRYHRAMGAAGISVLDSIVAGVREDLVLREQATSMEALKERASRLPSAIDARQILARDEVAVIAEVKRSSPSKGELAEITDPASLATEYEAGGASVISVLTEERRFDGSLLRPRRGARQGRHPHSAQGLHRHAVSGVGGASTWRGHGAAHRRGARADGPREPRRTHPLARHVRPR